MEPEIALFWSINAKNCLETVMGFPHISLFSQPIPSCLQIQGVDTRSKDFAKNINALHLAVEASNKTESSQVLKKALKNRIYTKGDNVGEGDMMYYKRGKRRIGKVLIKS